MGISLFCLIVGGVLFGLSLLGGADHDVAGHDLAADHPGTGDIASWFTLRALVSFAPFFGLAGVVGGFTAYLFRLARTRGEVLVSPAPGRPGRVAVNIAGQVTQMAAHSEERLTPSAPVIVIGQAGGGLEVKRWDGA